MRFWNPTLPHPIAPQAQPDAAPAHSAARAARLIGMLRPLPPAAVRHSTTDELPDASLSPHHR
jgi:hypothetical protein